jgi:alcohol dehydrogenase class IV
MPDLLSSAYDFLAPPRIVFGWGRRRELGAVARTLGRRAFVLHGSRSLEESGTLGEILDCLRHEQVEPVDAGSIGHEPEVADVDRIAAFLRRNAGSRGDLVIGVGGGSAMDLAKAAAALATNSASPTVRDYLEGVGKGLTLEEEPLPFLAVPTTAGTGTEATKNAVISSYDPPFKKSIRSDRMVARAVVVDPELSVTVPPETTAATGMDALTQLIESYISRKARPIPRALALDGLRNAGTALVRAYRDGEDRSARETMAHAALLSGLALANSGLGMAHGVAPALGIHARVPHGLACAVMLPVALRVNRHEREADIARLGSALCGRSFQSDSDAANAAIEKVEELLEAVRIPRRLGELGVRREQIPQLVESSRGSSMSGNPRELSDDELTRLLESLL